MPNQTFIDFSHMTVEELLAELKGLRLELEETQLREKQILHDMDKAMEELLCKLQAEKDRNVRS